MNIKATVIVYALLLLCPFCVVAQHAIPDNSPVDTNYISNFYYRYYLIRIYESTKYNSFKLIDPSAGSNVIYKPNDHNLLGVGFTYKYFGVNIGFGFPILNYGKEKYGDKDYLDLQSHLYLHKYVIDFYGQFYNGYYLADASDVLSHQVNAPNYPIRPDIHTTDIGVVFQYMLNNKQFSYRAAYVQNEYQKKSAGSFIVGGTAYHVNIKGDSSLVPYGIVNNDFFNGNTFNATNITSISANAGYAYTLVIKKHFFVMASLLGGVGVDYSTLYDPDGSREGRLKPEFNVTDRFSIGYNSNDYFIGVHYVGLITENSSPAAHTWQEVNAGNFRISAVKRFKLERKTLKQINGYENEVTKRKNNLFNRVRTLLRG